MYHFQKCPRNKHREEKEGGREGRYLGEHTSVTETREGPAEGLSARQREEEAGAAASTAAAAAKGLGLTSLCPTCREAGATDHAGREGGKAGEQEEQAEEEAEEEEEHVVVREEEREEEDDDKEEEEEGEVGGEG